MCPGLYYCSSWYSGTTRVLVLCTLGIPSKPSCVTRCALQSTCTWHHILLEQYKCKANVLSSPAAACCLQPCTLQYVPTLHWNIDLDSRRRACSSCAVCARAPHAYNVLHPRASLRCVSRACSVAVGIATGQQWYHVPVKMVIDRFLPLHELNFVPTRLHRNLQVLSISTLRVADIESQWRPLSISSAVTGADEDRLSSALHRSDSMPPNPRAEFDPCYR